jgi:hypothetical protein
VGFYIPSRENWDSTINYATAILPPRKKIIAVRGQHTFFDLLRPWLQISSHRTVLLTEDFYFPQALPTNTGIY